MRLQWWCGVRINLGLIALGLWNPGDWLDTVYRLIRLAIRGEP
jgi:hypothetical protein